MAKPSPANADRRDASVSAGVPSLPKRLSHALLWSALACCALSVAIGFFVAPLDPYQGGVHRIVYVHVPSTWLAILLCLAMAVGTGARLVTGNRLGAMLTEAAAPTGAMFGFMALWTGSLWGKPVWGTWWITDARLYADFALLAVFLMVAAAHGALEDPEAADRVTATIVLPGAALILALLATVAMMPEAPAAQAKILPNGSSLRFWTGAGMTCMALGFLQYSVSTVLRRMRAIGRERWRHRAWRSMHGA